MTQPASRSSSPEGRRSAVRAWHLWLLCLTVIAVAPAAPDDERPNVLIIIVDDQGYADLNADPVGRSADVTIPNIDRLVEHGALFRNAYATSPICSPSRAAISTGRYQQRWGNFWYGQGGLPGRETTLAESLKEAGYATGYFGKVHFGPRIEGPASEMFPTNIGYETFYGYLNHTIHYLKHRREYVDGQDPKMHGRFGKGPMWIQEEEHDQDGFTTELFAERARQFIRQNRDRPFLATLSFNALHNWVDQLPSDYLAEHNLHPIDEWTPDQDYHRWFRDVTHPDQPEGRRWYLGQLDYLDREIGKTLDLLEELGLFENTLIIYTSDNGGSPNSFARNVPLAGYKFSLAEGGIRVPFIVSWPARIAPGTYDQLVSALDIVPTVGAAVGEAPNSDWDGRNLLRIIDGIDEGHEYLVWDTGWEWAVRQGDWKLRQNIDSAQAQRIGELYRTRIPTEVSLYNLREDVGERENLAAERPDIVEALRSRYQEWRKTIDTEG